MCADALDCDAVFASIFNGLLLYRQSNPMLPSPSLNPAAITIKKTRYPDDIISGVPSCLGVLGGRFDIWSFWGLYKMHETLWFCLVSVND